MVPIGYPGSAPASGVCQLPDAGAGLGNLCKTRSNCGQAQAMERSRSDLSIVTTSSSHSGFCLWTEMPSWVMKSNVQHTRCSQCHSIAFSKLSVLKSPMAVLAWGIPDGGGMWTACGGLIELCLAVVSLTLQLLSWEHGRPFSSFRPGSQKACSRIQGMIQGWQKAVLQLGGHWTPVAGASWPRARSTADRSETAQGPLRTLFPFPSKHSVLSGFI